MVGVVTGPVSLLICCLLSSSGGVTDAITQIVALCREQAMPVVFALSRRRLAMILKKKHKIGCVGIFSYDGAEVGVWS